MQETSGEFNNWSYMMQSKRHAAMNFINFMKVASQDLYRGSKGDWNQVQCIVKALLAYYCISVLYCTSAEFVDDGLYEAQFFIVLFQTCVPQL